MTRLRIQLTFEVDGPFNVEDAMRWAGNELIGEGLNGLIDRKIIPGPVTLFDGVYRNVSNVAEAPRRRRR